MGDDILERLRAPFALTERDAQDAIAEIERLREENARLREALKPFSDMALYFDAGGIPSNRKVAYVQLRLLRAAAAAIRDGGDDENKKD